MGTKFDELVDTKLGENKETNISSSIVKNQPLVEIKDVNNDGESNFQECINRIHDAMYEAHNRLTNVFSSVSFPYESEYVFDNDINIEEKGGQDAYESYETLCDICMIKDIVGCNQCGIYQYAVNKSEYEITVRRIDNNGIDTK